MVLPNFLNLGLKRAQIFILPEKRKYVRFFLETCLKKKYSRDIRKRTRILVSSKLEIAVN